MDEPPVAKSSSENHKVGQASCLPSERFIARNTVASDVPVRAGKMPALLCTRPLRSDARLGNCGGFSRSQVLGGKLDYIQDVWQFIAEKVILPLPVAISERDATALLALNQNRLADGRHITLLRGARSCVD